MGGVKVALAGLGRREKQLSQAGGFHAECGRSALMERPPVRREDAHGGRGPVQGHLAELAGLEEQLSRALVPWRDEGGGLCLQQGVP